VIIPSQLVNTACHGEPVEPSRGVALRQAQGDTALCVLSLKG